MMTYLNVYFPIGEAIALLLYPYAEVVFHDINTGLIAAIYHNFSKRKVGDESLLEEIEGSKEFPNIFPIYLKTGGDGRKIKSVSVTLRDFEGKAIGLLCINVDLTKWEEFHHFLDGWLKNGIQPQPALLFKDDWREKINVYVSDYLSSIGSTLKQLDKEKKKALVRALYQEGAFKAKNSAHYVADILNLSRATIYNYLKDIKHD